MSTLISALDDSYAHAAKVIADVAPPADRLLARLGRRPA
jgi:hypothetical protein